MIELSQDQISFSFEQVHPDARIVVEFQRTIRIPEADREIPRLPGLGRFPLYAIEDHTDRVPSHWRGDGGAILPMYQSEAMWLGFRPAYSVVHRAFYPFAVKIEVGGADALTGRRSAAGIHQSPQDYLAVTAQSWLGGYRSPDGRVLQFSAMPLGSGYTPVTAETERALGGPLRISIFPMHRVVFEQRYPKDAWQLQPTERPTSTSSSFGVRGGFDSDDFLIRLRVEEGLFPLEDWAENAGTTYSLHLANSLHWCAITGAPPPTHQSRARTSPQPATTPQPPRGRENLRS